MKRWQVFILEVIIEVIILVVVGMIGAAL